MRECIESTDHLRVVSYSLIDLNSQRVFHKIVMQLCLYCVFDSLRALNDRLTKLIVLLLKPIALLHAIVRRLRVKVNSSDLAQGGREIIDPKRILHLVETSKCSLEDFAFEIGSETRRN